MQTGRQTGFGVKLKARNREAGRVLHFFLEVRRKLAEGRILYVVQVSQSSGSLIKKGGERRVMS